MRNRGNVSGVSGGRVWTGGGQLCEGIEQVEDSGGRGQDRWKRAVGGVGTGGIQMFTCSSLYIWGVWCSAPVHRAPPSGRSHMYT